MSDRFYGITYCPNHVYKVLRAKNTKGGGSKVSEKDFDRDILGWVFTKALTEYYDLLPDGRLSEFIEEKDKLLPDEMVEISRKIKKFLDRHGPFAPLAIGLMNCIIDMDTMGIDDYKKYTALKEHLIINPASSFKDYIEIITEFERGYENDK